MAADTELRHRALRLNVTWLGVSLAVTAVYYVLPLGRLSRSGSTSAAAFAVGLVGVVWAIVRRVRVVRTTGAHIGALLAVFYLAVVFFATTYYAVQLTWPEQFESLVTRTDALYFAVTIVATVGFGDVHAAGQLARVLVTIQMLFDVVIIGVGVTVARSNVGAGR